MGPKRAKTGGNVWRRQHGRRDIKPCCCRRVPPAKGALITQIKTEVLSSLQEDEARYYATAVVEKTNDRLKVATVAWPKEPLESWLARAENQMPKVLASTDVLAIRSRRYRMRERMHR